MAAIDFSSLVAGLDPMPVVGGVIAFGIIYVTVDFCRWAVREVGGFWEWYAYGDMDHDEQWHERFGRANAALNKIGLGR
nr:MAG TPA: hypothetical protein [Inoviridae sp.]